MVKFILGIVFLVYLVSLVYVIFLELRNGNKKIKDIKKAFSTSSNDYFILNLVEKIFRFSGAAVVLLFLISGINILAPGQQGLVFTFGKLTGLSGAGITYVIPLIQTVEKYDTANIYKSEVGFVTEGQKQYRKIPEDSKMFTSDDNIVHVEYVVLYQIADITKFALNIRDKSSFVSDISQSVMRGVTGKRALEGILTVERDAMELEGKKVLQSLCEKYNAGIKIVSIQLQAVDPPDQVKDAFKDVVSAKEDRIKLENEAVGYKNSILPNARGQSEQMINNALAEKERRIKEAEGDVAMFIKMYENYKLGEDITKTRLYMETAQKILKTKKIIVDKNIKNPVIIIGNADEKAVRNQAVESAGQQ